MATATKKTTTAAKKTTTATKETARGVKPAAEIPQAVKPDTTVLVENKPKVFAAGDLIPCRSVRIGLLQHIARKSGNPYEWSDYGDVTEVEYGDLLAMKAAKSKFIYNPWIIIEDQEAIEALKLTSLYDTFKPYIDVEAFLEKSPAEVRSGLQNAPAGFRDTIAKTAAQMIRDGSMDSIGIIKAIDDVLHKNLSTLISGGF